jgi:fused signal recognition particle receptor
VGRDAYDHAKKNHIDIVLMDTAGRMQTSKNLMDEMGKIVRVVKPDVKLFIGDALAGNDTINQAREFFHYTNFDGAILTKVDADAKGGSAISTAHITSKPIVYIGIGQGYNDIIPFDSNKFIASLFESAGQVGVNVEEVASMQKISELAAEKTNSGNAQTIREEGKDILLQSNPPVTQFSPSDGFNVQEKQEIKELPPKPILHQPEQSKSEEPRKEKKSRFGFFGKKRSDEDRSKEEEEEGDNKEKHKLEEKRAGEEEEEENTRLKHEEVQTGDKERNLQQDKGDKEQEQEEDKVVYLTDEDIEDLLK